MELLGDRPVPHPERVGHDEGEAGAGHGVAKGESSSTLLSSLRLLSFIIILLSIICSLHITTTYTLNYHIQAYAVLDKYKISKTFFVKTNQEDCALLDAKPSQEPQVEGGGEKPEDVRSAVVPDAPKAILDSKKSPNNEKAAHPSENPSEKKPAANTVPERIMEVADAVKEEEEEKKEAPTKVKEEGNVERAEEKKKL